MIEIKIENYSDFPIDFTGILISVKDKNLIVLVSDSYLNSRDDFSGTVLSAICVDFNLGDSASFLKKDFKKFKGTITLQQD